MSTIKRYHDIYFYNRTPESHSSAMKEDPSGDYVLFSDHEAALEPQMTVQEMYDEWQKCLADPEYTREKYLSFSIVDGVMHIRVPNWLKAFELIQPVVQSANELATAQRVMNAVLSEAQFQQRIKDATTKPEPQP